MIATVSCPDCGAPTQVVTLGLADQATCPNGHLVVWRPDGVSQEPFFRPDETTKEASDD